MRNRQILPILLSLLIIGASQANMVINPGFEDGEFTWWDPYDGPGVVVPGWVISDEFGPITVSGFGQHGGQSLAIEDGLAYQYIDVIPGVAYDISAELFYRYGRFNHAIGSVTVTWVTANNQFIKHENAGYIIGPGHTLPADPSGTWKSVGKRAVAPANARYMILYLGYAVQSNPAYTTSYSIDNVYVNIAGNLLDNPGFEAGPYGRINNITIPEWTKWGASGWVHGDDGPSLDPRGAKTLKLWHQDSGVYQDVTEGIIPGQEYKIGGYVSIYTNDPVVNRKGVIDVEWFNRNGKRIRRDRITRFAGTPGRWKLKAKALAAPSGAARVRVFLHVVKTGTGPATGAIHFDDLFIRYD